MFFSTLSPSATPTELPSTPRLPLRFRKRNARGHLWRVSLGVMLAMPAAGLVSSDRLYAANTDAAALALVTSADANLELADLADMPNADRLALGLQQFSKNQYEEAVATLQQVNADQLSAKDQKKLSDTLAKAQDAAAQRKVARAEFELGEQALTDNKPADALVHYKAAQDNRFADDGTRAKAREQSELAKSAMRKAADDLKGVYASAVEDYRAGRLEEAKAKFEQLRSSGFKAGLFQKSPGDYLKNIDSKLAKTAPAAEPVAAQPATPPAAPAEPVAAQPTTPPAAPAEPVAAQPTTPPAAPAEPVAAQPTTPPAAPAEPVAAQPATPPAMAETTTTAPAVPPVVVEPTATPPAGEQPTAITEMPGPKTAAEAYKLARSQYREGDWIAARQNFVLARDMGYKAGLFEDAPAKYLARMDAKEQADVEKARRQSEAMALAAPTAADADATAAPTTAPVTATGDAQTELSRTADAEKLKQQQNVFEAGTLVTQAEAARAASNFDQALALYTRAAELDPSNTAAINGKKDMLAQTGRTPGQPDLLQQREADVRVRQQAIQYAFDTAISDSSKAAGVKDFNAARQALERAAVARNTDPSVFPPEQLRQFDTQLASARTSLASLEVDARAAQADETAREAQERLRSRLSTEEETKRRTVRDLIRTSRQYVEQAKYTEALGVVDQILVVDPGNDYAVGVRPLIEDRALVAEQRKYRESFDRNFTKVLNESEEKKIPYSDILRYPENWPDLSETREKSVAAERGELAADAATAAQLDRVLPEINFAAVPFSDVVDFLRDITQANIFVNWKALEASGIDRNTPVTARLRNVKFSKALKTILDEVSGGTITLAYTIDEGVISISTEEDLAKNVVTRVYDIRDLIINVPDFTDAPQFSLQSTGGGGGGGGGQNPFGTGGAGEEDALAGGRTELVDAIIKLIEDIVSSESWKDNGGNVGSIRELSGQLIVTQTPENQRSLVRLLEQLRETRAIQVTIETRFLFVQRNFLEDIGVDVDMIFGLNGGVAGNIPGPISVQQTSSNFTQASRLDTTLPGSLGGTNFVGAAISTGVTFLDDYSVSVLLRATQAQVNSTQLTAPRVTLFNGQRAFVLVSTERAYVSDLTPVVGTGATGFDPTIDVVSTGVLLDVQATVSSDRKYVTLTLRPTLSRLLSLTTFPIGGNVVFGGDTSTQPLFNTANLQQPEIQITQVRTTVSVPDGGTLLLGGQTLSAEVEREEGVPILSKIPFLKRLFTNRGYVKDDQILLILVKPTIIIQRERENEQFPQLGQKTGT